MSTAILALDVARTALTTATAVAGVLPADFPQPGGGEAPPGSIGSLIVQVMNWAKWLCLGMVVFALMFLGAKMAIARQRGDSMEIGAGLGFILGGAIVIGSAGFLVGALSS
ncbi:hypothetical protein C5C00_11010 [Rathayibacter rathayi]|uniref:Conjugal transfer protein TrbC n=1 Tax=Rathayibacter rathayi TaxID=33887 RepID=A0ABX5AE19_RATRA|nr:hypothetical protein [Rathayibacter rathayi]PPG87567.1 hypothetical protein C5C47_10340 [Rathayibacter rathayi]PPG95139.1 hypothetical protein C5C00_11010 [Rathayibacter rathayi]PPH79064.1 hypothetical protein C5C40_03760 [Rathayibacter rathayi]